MKSKIMIIMAISLAVIAIVVAVLLPVEDNDKMEWQDKNTPFPDYYMEFSVYEYTGHNEVKIITKDDNLVPIHVFYVDMYGNIIENHKLLSEKKEVINHNEILAIGTNYAMEKYSASLLGYDIVWELK